MKNEVNMSYGVLLLLLRSWEKSWVIFRGFSAP